VIESREVAASRESCEPIGVAYVVERAAHGDCL